MQVSARMGSIDGGISCEGEKGSRFVVNIAMVNGDDTLPPTHIRSDKIVHWNAMINTMRNIKMMYILLYERIQVYVSLISV